MVKLDIIRAREARVPSSNLGGDSTGRRGAWLSSPVSGTGEKIWEQNGSAINAIIEPKVSGDGELESG
jgi:hypothetical protein